MSGSYGTVPSDFSDVMLKFFANSVARYTSRSYHFQFQRESDLSDRTTYFEILNEMCYYENASSHYLYSRHKKIELFLKLKTSSMKILLKINTRNSPNQR